MPDLAAFLVVAVAVIVTPDPDTALTNMAASRNGHLRVNRRAL